LGKEATPELVEKIKPDAVFVATGSAAIIPEIPGVRKRKVITAGDSLTGRRKVGKSVVMIGGGLVGCETTLYLAQKGKKVTIVESLDSIARDMWSASRLHLLKLLHDANVDILTNVNVLEITDKGIVIADNDGKNIIIDADTVVLAVGFKPDRELFETLKNKLPEVYAIGDCVETREVMSAVWDGFNAARSI
jgi:2-enoate reductase